MVTLPSEQSASPVQPANRDPAPGVAINVTTCAGEKTELQVDPQSMPAGLVVIVPVPFPALLTTRVLGGINENVAVQLRAADIVTLPSVQSASPVQPLKSEPAAGV